MTSDLPKSWEHVPISDVLEPNNNGKPFQQGWSPQCLSTPAPGGSWGVLKTTAIQHGEFWPHENKALPDTLEPRPQIEVKPGDVLMTCAGPRNRCGVACLVERTQQKLMMSGKMYRFRPHPEVMHAKYLMYFLMTHASQLEIDRMKTGINDSGLNLTHDRFAKLKVPLAPILEQRRIASKIEELFSEMDKGIETLTTTREQLNAYRYSVLKYAFAEAKESRLLPTVLAEPMSNGYSGKPVQKVTPWRVLSLSATTSGIFHAEYFKYLDEPGLESRDIWCDHGDVLVQRGNTIEYVGVPALYTGKPREFIFPDLMIRLRANPEIILPTYLCYAMSTSAIRNEMRSKAKGSAGTMPKISQKILAQLKIPYCKPDVQRRITRQIEALNSHASAIEADIEVQLTKASALRESILKQAFSGQLVAQDSKDEPATVLLERIRDEHNGTPTKRPRNDKNGKKNAA